MKISISMVCETRSFWVYCKKDNQYPLVHAAVCFSLSATNLTQLASQLPKLTPEVILASMKQLQQQQQQQQAAVMQVSTPGSVE